MIKKLTFIFIGLISATAFAEYRVYQYVIKNNISTAQDQPNSHMVTSTLNPVAYQAYYGGMRNLTIDLLRTWICPGHTGHQKKLCPSPYDTIIERTIQ